jgi:glucose-1-phosphate thymidylyltransferase
MLQVAGKPILGHILDRIAGLKDLGTVYVVVGFLAEKIEEFISENYDLDIKFVYQEDLRGLGFAIHLALEQIPSDDPLLVILGDTIIEIDLAAFMDGPDDALGVKEVDDPRRFGVAVVDGKYIRSLVEKPADPPSNLAVVGLYGIKSTALLRSCLKDIIARNQTAAGELQMTDALHLMVERGSKMQAHVVEHWFDCGKTETMLETNRHLLEGYDDRYEFPDAIIVPPSYVAKNATVKRSIIGPHVSVGDGATVKDSVITNSIISDGASVSRCVLENSMIGSNAWVSGHIQRLNVGESSEVGLIA